MKLLKKDAIRARERADNPESNIDNYAQGVLMGYYSIITLLKHQTFAFCIDQQELGLADIIPEEDLLGLKRNPNVKHEEDNWATEVVDEQKVKGYLFDTIILLRNQAIEAKKEANNLNEESQDYWKGELEAYLSTFSLVKEQANILEINEIEIGLADIESEFLSKKRKK